MLASCGEEKTVEGKSKEVKEIRVRAEAGDAEAQNRLITIYFLGEGVPRDKAEALKWHSKAAEQGKASSDGCIECVGENRHHSKLWAFKELPDGNPF